MKNSILPVVLLGVVLLAASVVWFTGSFDQLFGNTAPSRTSNMLSLDLETLQITMKTVSSPVIEELKFIESIDTLSTNESIDKLRNPFTRIYVEPPPSEKAKKKTTTKKRSTPKKKRIRRPKVVMTGSVWDFSNPYAILNGDIYGEGDIIRGYTVQTIQDTMVILANKDDIFSIILKD